MAEELNLETTPEEELDEVSDLSELEELNALDGADEEAIEEAEEDAPAECCSKKCRCANKRRILLIGGIALGLAIAAVIAAIFASQASKKD